MVPPELDDDPLAALRERIRRTADAADRLADDMGNGRARAGTTGAEETADEARALVALVQMLRELLPEELRRQVMDLVRQVLMLLRAVIDWYLARLEQAPGGSPRRPAPVVEDIPLD